MREPENDLIEVWNININPDLYTRDLIEKLSPNERLQTGKILIESQRQRFIISHAALRDILSRYINTAANDIPITRDEHGKPRLDNLYFNLSHSKDRALLAVSHHYEVGIDIEHINSKRKLMKIAQRFFSAQEYNWLEKLIAKDQTESFFHLWCMKEAYLKGLGLGIKGGLEKLVISDPTIKTISINHDNGSLWNIKSISPQQHYAAAIAYNNASATIKHCQWKPL